VPLCHSSSYSVFELVCWFVAFFSHVVERFGEFIIVQRWVCVLLSFVIYRKFVGGVGLLSFFFSLADVYCFMLYYMLLKFPLVYLTVLILVCVVDFDILRGFSWRVAFSAF